MRRFRYAYLIFVVFVLFNFFVLLTSCERSKAVDESAGSIPAFKVDPFWPKPLPNSWLTGQVAGVVVDSRDHIWIVHRPVSLEVDEIAAAQKLPLALCCILTPSVLVFDTQNEI